MLLLTDVFEKFVNTCLKYYNLDPCHYFSAPGLSWDAMLKMTKIELQKLCDSDMHIFIEQGMRGGICYAAKKHSVANESTQIKYHDMNNLYGKAMMYFLPYKDFKLISVNTVLNKKDNSQHEYFLEVEMYCPDELHDYQNDFPMAPEKLKVTREILSPDQMNDIKRFDIKIGTTKKLIPNLFPKNNYITHYRNLRYYLQNGWKLTKVHKILEFKQSPWMKPYIDFNTEKRMQATNESDKNFFKLMINSVYGKTMENMRKRMKIRIVTNKIDCVKYSSRPTFINSIIYGKNLVAIHEKPQEVKLNKPIYVGCAVLEESKLEMYKFWYDFLKKECNEIKLLYTWTLTALFLNLSIKILMT